MSGKIEPRFIKCDNRDCEHEANGNCMSQFIDMEPGKDGKFYCASFKKNEFEEHIWLLHNWRMKDDR